MTYKYNASLKDGTALTSKKRKYWKSGPDPMDHDKYYAWLKHRAQARYRKEDYSITWEQWAELWKDPSVWNNRGRRIYNVRLQLIDKSLGWHINNVEVTRRDGEPV